MRAIHTAYKGGSRYYRDDALDVDVPGVTSVLDMIPKPFLRGWYAKESATLAVDSIGLLAEMAGRDRQGAVDYIKGAAKRYTKARATIGSQAHDMFERMARGESVERSSQPRDVHGHHDMFTDFLDVVQPTLIRAEDIAWSDTYGYAGSFDAILQIRVNPETLKIDNTNGELVTVMADWKTGKDIYPDVALQMTAYAYADRIIAPDGSSTPQLPETYDGAVVLHITDSKWSLRSVRIGSDLHSIFLSALAWFETLKDWESGRESLNKGVLGKVLAESSGLVTGTERRAR